jgi:hypothetical protein
LINFDKRAEASDLTKKYLKKSEHKSNKELLKLNLRLKIDSSTVANEAELLDLFYNSIKNIKDKVTINKEFDLFLKIEKIKMYP